MRLRVLLIGICVARARNPRSGVTMDAGDLHEEGLPEQAASAESLTLKVERQANAMNERNRLAPPCFFSRVCRQPAAVEKAGRSVCQQCAETRVRGVEYPLRGASAEPLYFTGRAASEALDMVEDISRGARRRLRGGTWS
jgi:hypothetical protein